MKRKVMPEFVILTLLLCVLLFSGCDCDDDSYNQVKPNPVPQFSKEFVIEGPLPDVAAGGNISFAPGASRAAEFAAKYTIAVVDREDPAQLRELAPVAITGNNFSVTIPITEARKTPLVVIREKSSGKNILLAAPGRIPAYKEVPAAIHRIVVRGIATTPRSTAIVMLTTAKGIVIDMPAVTILKCEETSETVLREIKKEETTLFEKVSENNIGGSVVVSEFARAVQTVVTILFSNNIDASVKNELIKKLGETPSASTVLNVFVSVVKSENTQVRNTINTAKLSRSVKISETVIDSRSTENTVKDVIKNTIDEEIDVTPLVLEFVSISPSVVKPGETVNIEMRANEELVSLPRVIILGRNASVSRISEMSYAAQIVIADNDTGSVSFVIDEVYDKYGNKSRSQSTTTNSSSSWIDKTTARAPEFSIPGGNYASAIDVAIKTDAENATIKYTLDGTEPGVENGIDYSGPVNIKRDSTLKAVAVRGGKTVSGVSTAVYVINIARPSAVTPTFSPVGSTYYSTQSVILASATVGASIYYTLDGTKPAAGNGVLYNGPFDVSNSLKALAIAYKDGMEPSDMAVAVYTIEKAAGKAVAPVCLPPSGLYDSTQSVSLMSATENTMIIYTLDGTVPSSSNGYIYSGPFNVVRSCTLKAVAIKDGLLESDITNIEYIMNLPLPQVSNPLITPASGTFENQVHAEISCVTAGAEVYYTLDGTKPSLVNGQKYSGAVIISKTTTLSAIALKEDMKDSEIVSETYTNVKTADAPVFGLKDGQYDGAQSVSISTKTLGASIYYTLNGTVPSKTNGVLYNGTFEISASATIKAIAFFDGLLDSQISEAKYVITVLTVETPVLKPAGGTYNSTQPVEITSATAGADIYYTLDGSAASRSGIKYTGPIEVAKDVAIKAIAVKAGMNNSSETESVYIIRIPVAAPVFKPVGGTVYISTQEVEITCATFGATIYYTLDGGIPTKSSLKYEKPLTVSKTTVIKAISVKDGMQDSEVKQANYPIHLPVSEPSLSVAGGTYSETFEVTIKTNTLGAKIYYTLDGTMPSMDNGILYTSPVSIVKPLTIKSIAIKEDMTDSNIAEAAYAVPTEMVATPAISPNGGVFYSQAQITLTCATPGAEIYYTKDGSAPSNLSAKYDAPFYINTFGTVTIKAVAFKAGMFSSMPAASNSFNIIVLPPPALTLTAGSHGKGDNAKVKDLTAGRKYIIKIDGGNWQKVIAAGTAADTASPGPGDAGMIEAARGAVALTGTEITGLTNDKTYSVYEVINAMTATTTAAGITYTVKDSIDGGGLDLTGTAELSKSNIAVVSIGAKRLAKIARGSSGAAKISLIDLLPSAGAPALGPMRSPIVTIEKSLPEIIGSGKLVKDDVLVIDDGKTIMEITKNSSGPSTINLLDANASSINSTLIVRGGATSDAMLTITGDLADDTSYTIKPYGSGYITFNSTLQRSIEITANCSGNVIIKAANGAITTSADTTATIKLSPAAGDGIKENITFNAGTLWLMENMTLQNGKTLTIAANQTLTIAAGKTLTIDTGSTLDLYNASKITGADTTSKIAFVKDAVYYQSEDASVRFCDSTKEYSLAAGAMVAESTELPADNQLRAGTYIWDGAKFRKPPTIILKAGSHGVAGNAKATGLVAGKKYVIKAAGGNWLKITAAGNKEESSARKADDAGILTAAQETAALGVGVTEITGLDNDIAYSLYEVISDFPTPASSIVYKVSGATEGEVASSFLAGTSATASNISKSKSSFSTPDLIKIASGNSDAATVSVLDVSADSPGMKNLVKNNIGDELLMNNDTFKMENNLGVKVTQINKSSNGDATIFLDGADDVAISAGLNIYNPSFGRLTLKGDSNSSTMYLYSGNFTVNKTGTSAVVPSTDSSVIVWRSGGDISTASASNASVTLAPVFTVNDIGGNVNAAGGTFSMTKSMTVQNGKTLTVGNGKTLSIASGKTLTIGAADAANYASLALNGSGAVTGADNTAKVTFAAGAKYRQGSVAVRFCDATVDFTNSAAQITVDPADTGIGDSTKLRAGDYVCNGGSPGKFVRAQTF